mgnify:CR=1 FL=1
MLDLGNVEFKYVEKNTKIGEIVTNLVKELNDEKIEVKELDVKIMPLTVKFLTKNIFDLQYEGHSKIMIFINNDYELKLGMNSEGILSLSSLKYLTEFLVEIDKRIKKYLEEIKENGENENTNQKDNDKEELMKLIGEVFLEVLSGGFDKDGE